MTTWNYHNHQAQSKLKRLLGLWLSLILHQCSLRFNMSIYLFPSLTCCSSADTHYSCINWKTKYYLYPHGIISSCYTYAMDFEPKCFTLYLAFMFNLNQIILAEIFSITESVLCSFIITAFKQSTTLLL